MKKNNFGFWSIMKLAFIAIIVGGVVLSFKYPNESKLYAKKAYNYIMDKDSTVIIPLEKENNGMLYITVKLNDVPIRFILDTGCSTMLISNRDAEFLLHHKIVSKNNILGEVQSICANGSVDTNSNINIEKVELQGIVLNNIPCMVSNSSDTPLLLGQAVLSKLGKVTIDYDNNLLMIDR